MGGNYRSIYVCLWASLVVQMVKNLPAMQETWVRSFGQEEPLEKEMATHSSILAWRFHEQRSLVGYSPRNHKGSDMTVRLMYTHTHTHTHTHKGGYLTSLPQFSDL